MDIEHFIDKIMYSMLAQAFAPSGGQLKQPDSTTVEVHEAGVRRARVNNPEYGVVGVDVMHYQGGDFHKDFYVNNYDDEESLLEDVSLFIRRNAGFTNLD